MLILAILHNERVYQGNPGFLNAIYPMPSVSKVVVVTPPRPEFLSFDGASIYNPPIFREDSFDPTTRIRRGRFYVPDNPSRQNWPTDRVNHYPYVQYSDATGLSHQFDVFRSFQTNIADLAKRPLVLLGEMTYRTAWHIVAVERLFNGETLFTLKAADTLGLLPDLNDAKVPAAALDDVRSALEKVADAAHKYLPVPIIDVCRESARVILAAWLPSHADYKPGADLGDLIKQVPSIHQGIRGAASIIKSLSLPWKILRPGGAGGEGQRSPARLVGRWRASDRPDRLATPRNRLGHIYYRNITSFMLP